MRGRARQLQKQYGGLVLGTLGVLTACSGQDTVIEDSALAPFRPALPASFANDSGATYEARVALGRTLFHENRLSKNQDLSCNSCHDLAAYGVDRRQFSIGHRGQLGSRNPPTVYHAAGAIAQFWDGRAADIEAQAKGPVRNPAEMAMPSDEAVTQVLQSIPGYAEPFAKAFPGVTDPVSFDNAARAIGAFERQLVTPARWDRYLRGDTSALSEEEKTGFQTFIEVGCATCHSGTLLGGASYERAGRVEPWPNLQDAGRYEVTKKEGDRYVFKVPSLRNISETGPYFHDGSVSNLSDAVSRMASAQLGRKLSAQQIASIVTWLGALTGPLSPDAISKPELPPSGPRTPAPDPT